MAAARPALQMRLESLGDHAPVAQVDNRRAVQLGGPARILRGAQQPALYRPRERGLLLSARTVWSLHSGSAFNEDGLCARIIVHRPLICDGAIVLLESLQPSIESSPNVIDGHVVSALLNTSRYAANGHFWRLQAQKYDLDAIPGPLQRNQSGQMAITTQSALERKRTMSFLQFV